MRNIRTPTRKTTTPQHFTNRNGASTLRETERTRMNTFFGVEENIQKTVCIKFNEEFQDCFKRLIENPINTIQNVNHAQMPQRCTTHNNPFSLYCEIDRKPLCVSCMYQASTHKKHRVIPLDRATNQLKQDARAFEIKIQDAITELKNILISNNKQILCLQKELPQILSDISKFYAQLTELIKKQQETHLEQLNKFQKKFKYQFQVCTRSCTQAIEYISEKIRLLNKKLGDEHILLRRNGFQVLARIDKILPRQLFDTLPNFSNILDIKKLQEAKSIVSKKMILAFPVQDPRNYIDYVQKTTGNKIIDSSKFTKAQQRISRNKTLTPKKSPQGQKTKRQNSIKYSTSNRKSIINT